MANTTFYERGNAYHDSAGNPAIIKNGNELTFTDNFNLGGGGGGGTPYTPPAYSTEEHKTGRKWTDGKDIYERTIELAITSLSDTTTVIATNIDYVDVLVDSNFTVQKSNVKGCERGCAYISPDNELKIHVIERWGDIVASQITIQYTKTTSAELTNTRTAKKTVKKG